MYMEKNLCPTPLERTYHLSLPWGTMSPWRGLSPLTTLGDDQSLERIITSHFPGA